MLDPASFSTSFDSEVLLQQALLGLLARMPAVSMPQILQGPLEVGKDIVFRITGGFGETLLCACVVKNHRLSGSMSDTIGVRTIANQAEAALDSDHTNAHGEVVRVERVYVVVPYPLSPHAIESIKGRLRDRSNRLVFVAGPELFELFRTYYPEYLASEYRVLATHITEMSSALSTDLPLRHLVTLHDLGSTPKDVRHVYVQPSLYCEVFRFRFLAASPPRVFPSAHAVHKTITYSDVEAARTRLTNWLHLAATLPVAESLSAATVADLRQSGEQVLEQLKHESERPRSVDADASGCARVSISATTDRYTVALRAFNRLAASAVGPTASALARGQAAFNLFCADPVALLGTAAHDTLEALEEAVGRLPRELDALAVDCSRRLSFKATIFDETSKSFVVLGPAGYGKTSFCRWHALRDIEAFSAGRSTTLPVYVPLHSLSTAALEDFDSTFLRFAGSSALLVQTAKSEGAAHSSTRLYLDGLDEIPNIDQRKRLLDLVERGIASRSPSVQVVMTSRLHVYNGLLRPFVRLYLGEFGDAELLQLAERWLADFSQARGFITQVRNSAALSELARIPLLATIMVLVYRRTRRLSTNRAKLYQVFVELLCGGWDLAKGVQRPLRYDSEIKLAVLERVAFDLHMAERKLFDDKELTKSLANVFPGLAAGGSQFRDELLQDGLIERGGQEYGFAHLSFQEFLAARYLLGDPREEMRNHVLAKVLRGNTWWRDVVLHYVCLSRRASQLRLWLNENVRRQLASEGPDEMKLEILDAACDARRIIDEALDA